MVDFYEDNIDVTCTIDGDEWDIIEAEVQLTKNSTPNYVDMLITPAEGTPFPSAPQRRHVEGDIEDVPDAATETFIQNQQGGLLGADFTLDVDTDLRADTADEEVTRIFTGNLANITPTGEYTFEALANDATQEPFYENEVDGGRNLQTSTVTIGRPAPRGKWSGVPTQIEEPDRSILMSEVVEKICDRLQIPEDERHINLQEDGVVVGEGEGGEIRGGYDELIEFESWKVNMDEALTRAEEASESQWWFDRYGEFHFGPLIPDENINAYEIQFITDSSAGMTTPPYRSVRVIGDGVVSEEGWTRSSLISEARYSTSGNVYLDEDDADLAEPTFTYRNMSITTASEAEHVRNQVIDKLESQRAEGEVTVVGFPEIYPNDAIQMPSTGRQPMGGARYGVHTVVHRLNSSDGFITKLKVEGLDSSQQTIYEDGESFGELEEDLEETFARFGESERVLQA